MKWDSWILLSVCIFAGAQEVTLIVVEGVKDELAFVSPRLGSKKSTVPSFENRNSRLFVSSSLDDENPLVRAAEIANIVFGQASPLIRSLLAEEGLPGNWEVFWSRSAEGVSNAQRMTNVLEQLGPTYVKFGQALGSRPDVIPPSLAAALSTLQDDMIPFDTNTAKEIVLSELKGSNADIVDVQSLVKSLGLSEEPIAAASVGQVYKANIPNYGDVAVKVQRPGIRSLVERDAALLRTVATWVESIPPFPNQQQGQAKRLIATELVDAVDEFMSRIFEELDYRREAENADTFARLYSSRYGAPIDTQVVVPEILPNFCTENVIVMEWLDGTKLTAVEGETSDTTAENFEVVKQGIKCTLRQLLVDGVLHADPHAGNLLKVKTEDSKYTLGYLDFGILSTVPSQVRDGLVCAVAQLVFAKDVDAVANLFGELQLLPMEILEDAEERAALSTAMELTMSESLQYPDPTGDDTQIPVLLFDKLLDSLARIVPRFRFQLPPYFINNARALSTLEGIARSLDPTFNVLEVMYPYALTIMLENPSGSPVVEETLQKLIRSPGAGRVDPRKLKKLLNDSALISGYRKRRVMWDVLKTGGGRKLIVGIVAEEANYHLTGGRLGKARKIRRRKRIKYFKL